MSLSWCASPLTFPTLFTYWHSTFRVEQALGEQGIPGRDYLEKILQIGIDLPAVPAEVMNSQVFRAIDATFANATAFDLCVSISGRC